MKKRNVFLLGLLAILLAMGMVLTGCDADGGESGDSGGGSSGGGGGGSSTVTYKIVNSSSITVKLTKPVSVTLAPGNSTTYTGDSSFSESGIDYTASSFIKITRDGNTFYLKDH
jgi:hypothetical protein